MPGRPTSIPSLEMSRPDGSQFTRTEMEAQIRERWRGHQPKRLKAINPYGLASKIAYDTPTIVILHWLLDEMIRRGEITGNQIGVDIPAPGHYDNPETFSQFKQRLLIAIEQGSALRPEEGEGINMSDLNAAPPPTIPGAPPNGQSGHAYTPPPAPAMPGAAPPAIPGVPAAAAPPAAAPTPPQPQAAAPAPQAGGTLFPKEDPDRPWGKPSPTSGRSRRTKQEMGEDQLWQSLGSPQSGLTFGSFEQVYGVSYAKAKKDKMFGPSGEFPALPGGTPAAAPQTTQPQPQTQVPTMSQPPVPMPPGMPQPPAPAAAPPPAPPMPGGPPAGMAPPQPAGMPQGVPQPHPQAPVVPPPPGVGAPPAPPQAAAPPMPPGMPQAAPPQAAAPVAASVDLGPVLERLVAIERKQAAIDAAIAMQIRSAYQKAGEYTCESILGELGIQVPQ